MARGSNSSRKPEFQMTPQLERFRYEVAQEIGLAPKLGAANKIANPAQAAQPLTPPTNRV